MTRRGNRDAKMISISIMTTYTEKNIKINRPLVPQNF